MSYVAQVYADLILSNDSGLKTIDNVPNHLKSEVQEIINVYYKKERDRKSVGV